MAVRIRKNGRIFCAALSNVMDGDCYIDDETHYQLSSVNKLLVTTENDYHIANGGEWWWKGQEPNNITIDPYYYS